jgi:hypothetical protein
MRSSNSPLLDVLTGGDEDALDDAVLHRPQLHPVQPLQTAAELQRGGIGGREQQHEEQ